MRRPGPDAGGRRTETVTLSCGHRVTDCIVNHPLVLPGSSIRCPTCAVPRTVLRVESSPMISGSSSSEHNDTARRQKILILTTSTLSDPAAWMRAEELGTDTPARVACTHRLRVAPDPGDAPTMVCGA